MQEPVMIDLAPVPPPVPPPPVPPPPASLPPPIPLQITATGCFTGGMRAFRKVILRGALLQVVTAVFGQYACYRARRYRLTRTVFRGIRFHQSGSPWSYALRSLSWWIVTAMTLGLAYPGAQASLELTRQTVLPIA